MPSFKSVNGIWEPAHERVSIKDEAGEPQIYSGPDREASKYIEEEGGVVGQDAAQDPQVLQASRNMGFKSVEEYLAHFKPTPKQAAEIKEAQSKPVTHALPKGKPEANPLGTKGGFYDGEKSNPQKEFDKKG